MFIGWWNLCYACWWFMLISLLFYCNFDGLFDFVWFFIYCLLCYWVILVPVCFVRCFVLWLLYAYCFVIWFYCDLFYLIRVLGVGWYLCLLLEHAFLWWFFICLGLIDFCCVYIVFACFVVGIMICCVLT